MQSEDEIIKRITRLIASFWILMKIISLKLWIKDRNYPLVPLVDMPALVHYILLILFFLLAAWLIYKPASKRVMMALIAIEMITILGDQNRLQPWHYQYIFTFFTIAANFKNKAKALQGIALIMVCTYLFSGLQKLNPGFISFIWSVHILKGFLGLPGYIIHNPVVHFSSYLLPMIEVFGAIGLLFQKTRKQAAMALIGMHIFLLLFLGPFGINYNIVVWPWNVLMIILLHWMFTRNQVLLRPSTYYSKANFVIVIFWIAMPFAGLFGYWDKFLSSGMYSGRGKLVQFYFDDKNMIPAELRKYAFYSRQNNSGRIVLTEWSIAEMNVAAVTEPRLLKSIVQQLNERYASQHATFELTDIKTAE